MWCALSRNLLVLMSQSLARWIVCFSSSSSCCSLYFPHTPTKTITCADLWTSISFFCIKSLPSLSFSLHLLPKPAAIYKIFPQQGSRCRIMRIQRKSVWTQSNPSLSQSAGNYPPMLPFSHLQCFNETSGKRADGVKCTSFYLYDVSIQEVQNRDNTELR